jgi:L-ascorbate metabolism protein UlaG (beta-lactamase superfamily)
VITPLLADDAFLADVRAAASERDRVHLWWLGQSGFLIQHAGRHLLMDPYLSDSLTKKYARTDKPHVRISQRVIDPRRLNFIDTVTSSHNHTDHLDASTLWPLLEANPNLRMIVPAANVKFAADRLDLPETRFIGLADGDSLDYDITAVPAAHDQREFDAEGRDKYLGYIVELGGRVIYHSGDTVRFDGMDEILRRWEIDLAILPINGKLGNLNGVDAARLAKDIGAKLVVPCHYDMFEFNTADPNADFAAECKRLGQPFRVLQMGERFTL